jgi:hypothetical protein
MRSMPTRSRGVARRYLALRRAAAAAASALPHSARWAVCRQALSGHSGSAITGAHPPWSVNPASICAWSSGPPQPVQVAAIAGIPAAGPDGDVPLERSRRLASLAAGWPCEPCEDSRASRRDVSGWAGGEIPQRMAFRWPGGSSVTCQPVLRKAGASLRSFVVTARH